MGLFNKAGEAFSKDEKFYFNLSTGQVEQGRVSGTDQRMGPYDTREEAAAALEKARERNETADEAEARWNEED